MILGSARAGEESLQIRLNTVGYLPGAEKKATIAVPCTNFTLIRVSDGSNVFSGTVTGPVLNEDTQEQLYTANFSAVHEPGQYRVEVPTVGQSSPFRIAADVYRDPFSTAMLGMYLWRCGTAVSATYHGQTFAHAACHTNDGWLDFVGGGHTQKDGTKGWHDAGDYNKYTVNAGLTVGNMLWAWEDFGPQIRKVRLNIPESGGPLPDFLAEIKWELDWVLTMQAPDGSAYHKLTTQRFGGFIMPEAETTPRYFTPAGTESTAFFVAMTAQASRAFRPFDKAYADRCLQAAERAYEYLKQHPNFERPNQTNFRTGVYEIRTEINEASHRLNGIPNNRLWSRAELWETTGSPEVLKELEKNIVDVNAHVNDDFDWEEVKNLGLFRYAISERPGRDPAVVKLVLGKILAVADGIVQVGKRHGYGRTLGTTYGWGCNGSAARQTLLLMVADRLTRNEAKGRTTEYRAACMDTLNYLLGRNCYGRSFITGVGGHPPMNPHDRRSGADKIVDPWPGYLVGGPWPKATDWKDDQGDARTNEIAINWNAALIYAMAAFLQD